MGFKKRLAEDMGERPRLKINPLIETFRPEQMAYFEKCLRDWYDWHWGKTGFIMPNRQEREEIEGKINKAVKATLRNRP